MKSILSHIRRYSIHQSNLKEFLASNLVKSQTSQVIRQMRMNTTTTVGIIVIGDEIVKGQVQDCNSFYLCGRFHQLGAVVKKVVVIPDDINAIGECVREFSKTFTHVITTGGIGPTHDDITYEAVAVAFNMPVKVNGELEAMYKGYFKEKYTETHKKLATIPDAASLIRGSKGKFPVVNIENVYILPGVPKFLKLAFLSLEDLVGNPTLSRKVRMLYLDIDEMSIAEKLTSINQEFSSTVTIGSYPEWHNNYFKVKIVLESSDTADLDKCEAAIRSRLPSDRFVDYDVDPLYEPMKKLEKLQKTSKICSPLTEALAVCSETLSRYSLDEVCIGFNGGKDCTALLHLWYAVVSQHPGFDSNSSELKTLYIKSKTPFPEVEFFIEQSVVRYKLKMMRFNGGIKDQLAQMKQQHPSIKAVIMGTRSTDPHGDMDLFQMTDGDWPELMRVNPILNFSYNDVWELLRSLNLPYCSLYDMGYTSLGSVENTHVNPALRSTDSNGVISYNPAYTLQISDQNRHLERAGRHS